MAKEIPKFPTKIWDGLSRNKSRTDILDNINPNSQDWSQMVAEMIGVQTLLYCISPLTISRELSITFDREANFVLGRTI